MVFFLLSGHVPDEELYGEGRQLMFIYWLVSDNTRGFEAPDNSASFLVTGQWSIIHQCEVMLGLLDAVKLLPARLGSCLPDILSVVALACSSSFWHSAIFHVSDSDSVHMDCFFAVQFTLLKCDWQIFCHILLYSPPYTYHAQLSWTRQTSDWHCAIVRVQLWWCAIVEAAWCRTLSRLQTGAVAHCTLAGSVSDKDDLHIRYV